MDDTCQPVGVVHVVPCIPEYVMHDVLKWLKGCVWVGLVMVCVHGYMQ